MTPPLHRVTDRTTGRVGGTVADRVRGRITERVTGPAGAGADPVEVGRSRRSRWSLLPWALLVLLVFLPWMGFDSRACCPARSTPPARCSCWRCA